MKTLKQLFALMLTLALVLSLAVPVMANDDVKDPSDSKKETNPTYEITISDIYKGHTYEAYQIFAGDYHEGILSNIKWGTGFQKA